MLKKIISELYFPSRLNHMSHRQTYPFETLRLEFAALENSPNPVSPLIPRLPTQHVTAAVCQLQQILHSALLGARQSQIIRTPQRNPNYHLSKSKLILNMKSQSVMFKVSIDEDLVWWIGLFKNIVLVDEFMDDELEGLEIEVVGRRVWLQNMVLECSLKVFDSVVLLPSQETVTPRVWVYDSEYALLLSGSDEVF